MYFPKPQSDDSSIKTNQMTQICEQLAFKLSKNLPNNYPILFFRIDFLVHM